MRIPLLFLVVLMLYFAQCSPSMLKKVIQQLEQSKETDDCSGDQCRLNEMKNILNRQPSYDPDSNSHHRSKRFIFWFPWIFGFLWNYWCSFWCYFGGFLFNWCIFFCRIQRENKPPRFYACTQPQKSITTPWNSSVVKVEWPQPKADDPENGDITRCCVNRIYGKRSGSMFREGLHEVLYTAKDYEDRRADRDCKISFRVHVPKCSRHVGISNAKYTASSYDFFHGTKITYHCHKGYEIHGNQHRICQRSGKYDVPAPECKRIKCTQTERIYVRNGKPLCSPADLTYETVCVSTCNEGYEVKADSKSTRCQDDKTWSKQLPGCVGNVPPVLKCPDTIKVPSDSGKISAIVTWTEPKATDSSGLDPVIEQVLGSSSGSTFYSNKTNRIVYVATNQEGINSTCEFLVIVETIYCEPPVFSGKYLEYHCPQNFRYGATCYMSCMGNYKVAGADNLTCLLDQVTSQPYWEFGGGIKPYCKEAICKDLSPPANGALACDKWLFGTMCQMQCERGFDIPTGTEVFGSFVCSTSSGKWRPSDEVPGCISRSAATRQLPAEIFYYTGNCSDEKTQDEIKDNFITHMKSLHDSNYEGVCEDETVCNVENVIVVCGNQTQRAKRSADFSGFRFRREVQYEIRVTFTLTVTTNAEYNETSYINTTKEILDKMSNLVVEAVYNGDLDVEGVTLEKNSTTFGELSFYCNEGQIFKASTLSCVGCPLGKILNSTNNLCEKCPLNTYREKESNANCMPCPEGSFTRKNGSKTINDCKFMCMPGFYSVDGLQPCSSCKLGYYQSNHNSTFCLKCPNGKATATSASSSVLDCKEHDAIFKSNGSFAVSKTLRSEVYNFTLMFWLKGPDPLQTATAFSVSDTDEQFLLTIGKYLEFQYKTIHLKTKNNNPNDWTHNALVVSQFNDSIEVTLYQQGHKANSSIIQSEEPIIRNQSRLLLQSLENNQSAHISGLSLEPVLSSEEDIMEKAKTCGYNQLHHNDLLGPLFDPRSWELNNVDITVPSQCDEVNECLSSPCGEHNCINSIGGYNCSCKNGFTGTNCEIPPDYCLDNECTNGATCVNINSSYICQCSVGYKGMFCQEIIVNGNWSLWSEWTTCTLTCNRGSKERYRFCNNPVPDPDGLECIGNNTEIQDCNEEACPTCPEFPVVEGVLPNCTVAETNITCTVSCQPGMDFSDDLYPLKEYVCGEETNYEWNGIPPSCIKFHPPEKLVTTTSVTYPKLPCRYKTEAKEYIYNNMEDLQCVHNRTCNIDVELTGCEEDGVVTDNVLLDITLTSNVSNGQSLDLEEFFETNNVSKGLLDFLVQLVEISNSTIELNRTEALYRVDMEGETYDADMTTINFSGNVSCPEGKIAQEAMCADCPLGTFSENSECHLCGFGTYQDEMGQTSCKDCPQNFSTASVGSKNVTDCKVSCQRGTYFYTGVCIQCANGTYQDEVGQTDCKNCSEGYISKPGAISASDCIDVTLTTVRDATFTPQTKERTTPITKEPSTSMTSTTQTTTVTYVEYATKIDDIKSDGNVLVTAVAIAVPIVLLLLIVVIAIIVYRTRTTHLDKKKMTYQVNGGITNPVYMDIATITDDT